MLRPARDEPRQCPAPVPARLRAQGPGMNRHKLFPFWKRRTKLGGFPLTRQRRTTQPAAPAGFPARPGVPEELLLDAGGRQASPRGPARPLPGLPALQRRCPQPRPAAAGSRLTRRHGRPARAASAAGASPLPGAGGGGASPAPLSPGRRRRPALPPPPPFPPGAAGRPQPRRREGEDGEGRRGDGPVRLREDAAPHPAARRREGGRNGGWAGQLCPPLPAPPLPSFPSSVALQLDSRVYTRIRVFRLLRFGFLNIKISFVGH